MKPFKKPERDERDGLAEFLCAITGILRETLEVKKTELECLKSHSKFVTKQDLERTEQRLTDAIEKNVQVTPAIVSAVERLGASLDSLDATVPDKTNI